MRSDEMEEEKIAGPLKPERATESASAVVRLCTVVVHEHAAETAVAKQSAAEFSHFRRCLQPARRFRIELAKFLQLAILLFGQKLDAHSGGHVHRACFRFKFL